MTHDEVSKLDLTGKRVGHVTIVRLDKTRTGKGAGRFWVCRCDCGAISVRKTAQARRRGSCVRCINVRHGCSRVGNWTAAYKAWMGMKARCNNPNSVHYLRYGGRGIRICPRWRKFENFLQDMGEPPASHGYSLERVNNDRGYSPRNCRWIPKEEQARNRRTSRFIVFNGRRQILADWAREFNVTSMTLWKYLDRGHMMEEAAERYLWPNRK